MTRKDVFDLSIAGSTNDLRKLRTLIRESRSARSVSSVVNAHVDSCVFNCAAYGTGLQRGTRIMYFSLMGCRIHRIHNTSDVLFTLWRSIHAWF